MHCMIQKVVDMPLESVNSADAFKLGILGGVEKR